MSGVGLKVKGFCKLESLAGLVGVCGDNYSKG